MHLCFLWRKTLFCDTMFSAVPTDAACTETVTDLSHQDIALTLLRHCQSMKRQEMRLRLTTGFMILVGFAVIFCLHFQKRSSTSVEPTNDTQWEPVVQAQHDPRSRQTFHFELTAVPNEATVLKWRNGTQSNTSTYILIPTDGQYFLYVNIPYRMPATHFSTPFKLLNVNVTVLSGAYPKPRNIFFLSDTIACVYPNFRNIYIGRLFRLRANDRLEVKASPYELIEWKYHKVVFGGYLVHGTQNQN